ncbi:MAG: methionyl-tRNA formyltransferase [Tissierellia bacterium]|nr:methionyl-tRNA formyltransferase [Tissierellia bacterium]
MKIVFMGTPEFAVPALEAIKKSGIEISLVISQKDKRRGRGKKLLPTPVKEKALELGLDVYQPENINSEESVNKLREIQPDCIVVVAYGQILKRDILILPPHGCVNIHASLLPKYRGAAPINWAIIRGEKETGITIMKMDEGLDTGDILKSESIPIEEEDDSSSVHDKLSILGGKLIVETLIDMKNGNIKPIPQDDNLSSYAPMLNKEMGKIDWNNEGEDIINLIRGLKPWPSAYIIYKGEKVKIHKAKKIKKLLEGENGKVVKVQDDGIYVNCSDSCIVIEELQFPGKKNLKVSEFLRGNQFDSDIVLE